jgi:hypothetical protein
MLQDADPSTWPKHLLDSTFTINRVSIRVLPFWPEKRAMWFMQLEGQFALLNITQDVTKFYYIISQLDNIYVSEVEDVITNFPPTGCYDRIKAELIGCLSLSDKQHVCLSLMYEEMWRPTQFLHHLQPLASLSVPSDFLRTLWTNCLPPNIQVITATQAQVALNDVTHVAYKTAEVTPPPRVTRLSSSGDDISTLTARIDKLAQQVAILSTSSSRLRSPSQT